MLQMEKERLKGYSQGNIGELLGLATPILRHREELYRRYTRKRFPEQTMHAENGKARAIVPFEYYIVNMVQGYLGGKAPVYSVQRGGKPERYAEGYQKAIEYIRRYNDDAATYIELLHDYLITAAAYLYVYENESNEIVYTRFDSRQTAAVFDFSTPPNLIGCVRVWQKTDPDGVKQPVIEVITDTERTVYTQASNGYLAANPEPIAWGDVPVVAIEHPDNIAVFEPALGEIDAFEENLNNVKNMTRYNDNAKLLLKHYQFENEMTIRDENGRATPNPAREEEEEAILRARAVSVGEGGEIQWLIKNVDYTGIIDTLKQYHELITMLTGVPNMTDEAFSNADNASALGYKLYALDQYSASTDRMFRKGYLRLWELITNRLNLKGDAYDFRDIDIAMQRNIPTDKDRSIDRAARMKSSGLFSDETCINESQVEVDPTEEAARVQAEQEADFQLMQEHSKALMEQGEPDEGEEKDGAGQGGSGRILAGGRPSGGRTSTVHREPEGRGK